MAFGSSSFGGRKEEPNMSGVVRVDRRLLLTEDKSRVVEEGDPAGRWLWASVGDEVLRSEAERLGAIKPPEPEPEPEPVKPEPPKKRATAANKAMPLPEDK